MSSVLVSSQCQCATVAVPNLHAIPTSTSSSTQRTSPDDCALREQPFRSGYGLSKRSTLEPPSGALPCERLDGKFSTYASSSSSDRSRNVWRGRRRPAAGSSGNLRVVLRAVDGPSCGDSEKFRGGSAVQQLQRRGLVRVILSWVVLPVLINAGSALGAAAAENDAQGSESSTIAAPPAKTLVERLLERSKANKAKYDQERLDAYYRRNFKDYFEFLKGGIQNKDVDKLTEAEKGILSWLEKNK